MPTAGFACFSSTDLHAFLLRHCTGAVTCTFLAPSCKAVLTVKEVLVIALSAACCCSAAEARFPTRTLCFSSSWPAVDACGRLAVPRPANSTSTVFGEASPCKVIAACKPPLLQVGRQVAPQPTAMALAAGAAAAACAAEAAVVCAVAAARRRAQSRVAGLPPAVDAPASGDGGDGSASGPDGGLGGPASYAAAGLGAPSFAGFAASAPDLGPGPATSRPDLGAECCGPATASTAFHKFFTADDGDIVTAASMQRLAKFALADWVTSCDLIKQGLDALPFPHGRQQAHVDPCWILAGWDNRPDPPWHTVTNSLE